MEKSKLSLADIKLGDIVYASSLNNICNVHIILVDCVNTNADVRGRVAYIGDSLNSESDKIVEASNHIMGIYHTEDEFDEGIDYDE